MLRPINVEGETEAGMALEEATWVKTYYTDFKKRLLNLFGYEFRALTCSLAFQFIGEKNANQGQTDA